MVLKTPILAIFDFKADIRFFAFSTASIVPPFFIDSASKHVFIPGDAARSATIEFGEGFRILGGSNDVKDWIENNPDKYSVVETTLNGSKLRNKVFN
jgi:hypothetical protein